MRSRRVMTLASFVMTCIQIQKTERGGFSVTDVEVGHMKPVQVQKKAK